MALTVATTDSNGLIVNDGLIDITGASTFKSDDLNNTSGTLKVEASQTLTLIHTSVKGGTALGSSSTSTSKISGGTITVDSGGTLTMAGSSSGDLIAGSTVDVSGTLNMTGIDTISGGSLSISGTLNADGSSATIEDSARRHHRLDGGTLNVSGSLTLTDEPPSPTIKPSSSRSGSLTP